MDGQDTESIWASFERAAAHFSNIGEMEQITKQTILQAQSIKELIKMLQERSQTSRITLQTDIRILINEIEHDLRKRKQR
ncbi:MAG: hypothetical protein K9W43_00215 [Candidatus Thorarchaeota archaeon]|nr:hypothetical protein [Candidatus Thorarchaeota archaeon]